MKDHYHEFGAFELKSIGGKSGGADIRVRFGGDSTIETFLENVEAFMRAAGYYVAPGARLELVEDDAPSRSD